MDLEEDGDAKSEEDVSNSGRRKREGIMIEAGEYNRKRSL